MPRKLAHAVDVGRHERHDLRLARKLVLVFLFFSVLAHSSCGFGVVCGLGRSRGSDVLANERLGEEDGIELHADTNLQRRRGYRPQLARDCHQCQKQLSKRKTSTHLDTE